MTNLQTIIDQVVRSQYPQYQGEVSVVVNRNLEYGDYATPVAFNLSKELGQSPAAIAHALVQPFQEAVAGVAVVSVPEGSPFINFRLTEAGYTQLMTQALETQNVLIDRAKYTPLRVLIEFISANPTGPLTLANGRGGFSGDALANCFTFAGASVEREYYYNDSGNQIMELGRSVVAARKGEEIEGGYKGPYIQELSKIVTVEDPYTSGQESATYIFNHWIKPMIARMGVNFTRYASEQSLIDEGIVDAVVAMLHTHGLLYDADGALWLRTTDYGDDKDRVMRRTDGTYTYLMKDIAYHWHKIQRNPTHMFTIVGADHYAEAKTLDMIVRHILAPAANWNGQFIQPIIQFVRLMQDGKEVKMSKRAGNFVTIDDLLDEINPDVARFFFLMRDLSSSMDFDLTLARDASDKNPVYYVQYALVRAKHILESNTENTSSTLATADLSTEERQLLLHLLSFSPLVEEVLETYATHKLPYYAIDLAKHFHAFYAKHPVLKADSIQRSQRLALTQLTHQSLVHVLHLMGVSQPDRMVRENNETAS